MNSLCKYSPLAFLYFCLLFPITSADYWWHISAGREILEHGWIHQDFMSFPHFGKSWNNIHWLYQVITFAIHEYLGLITAALIKPLFVVGIIWIHLRLWKPTNPFIFLCFAGWALFPFRFLALNRPTLFTLVILHLMIWVLVRQQGKGKWISLSVLQILLSNLQGLFILGPALVICYLVAEKSWKELKWIPLLYCLSMIHPLGVDTLIYPFKIWWRISSGAGLFSQHISENAPLWLSIERGHYVTSVLLVIGILSLQIYTLKSKLSSHTLMRFYQILGLPLSYLALTSQRNQLLWVLLMLPLVYHVFKEFFQKLNLKFTPLIRTQVQSILPMTMWITLAALTIIHMNSWWAQASLKSEAPMRFPSQQILARLNSVRIFNADQYGGFIHFHTKQKVFMDGRFILREPDFFTEYIEVLEDPQIWPQFQSKWGFQQVLIPFQNQPKFIKLANFLTQSSQWTLLAQDESSLLFEMNLNDNK